MTVHTGPNTGPGGCHRGFLSRRYQRLSSALVVASAPSPAVAPIAPRTPATSHRVSPPWRCSGSGATATEATLPTGLGAPGVTSPGERAERPLARPHEVGGDPAAVE